MLKKFNQILNYNYSNKKIIDLLKQQSSRYIVLDESLTKDDYNQFEIHAFNNKTQKFVTINVNQCLKNDQSFTQMNKLMQNKVICKDTLQLLNSYLHQEQILVDTQEIKKDQFKLLKDCLQQQVLQIYSVQEKVIEDSDVFYQDNDHINSNNSNLSRQFDYCLESFSDTEIQHFKDFIQQINHFDILNLSIRKNITITAEQSQKIKNILQSEYSQRRLKLILRNPEFLVESWVNLIKGFNCCRQIDLDLVQSKYY
ncbi:hypothetical protein TTHERM_00024090 (macronuclear) [Tetrahymena thermophila SB210]|uniref:Uncharacterized protein n=1 Tax=Tetrahymena thermophila (strain SB210) TaxID=312017 RepID=Q22R72_TETTS|nr:hypothetical protein TTHERM_00024090 [Tetrahymena thermophila SB210]EAR88250.2 hypothetical protein TTHERM_00024090 [Tetrahymena thermophila SB210]|eukprot:XP_001008495.2 hypothetical protein TTHERM_00024090 [Tetrahymena thermophila SB210]